MELAAPLLHRCGRLAEVVAAAGSHFDFGCDQLTDDVRRQVGLDRRCVELLEAPGELERLRVEDRQFLFDGEGEIGALVERVTRRREELLPGDALFLAHSAGA
jgi:hypothetical protein